MQIVRSASPEADSRTGFRKSARAERIKDGLLPPPFALGGRARGWLSAELEEIAAALAAGATDDEIRGIVRSQVERRKARLAELKAA